jgi:CheY-like chemotaxis protein
MYVGWSRGDFDLPDLLVVLVVEDDPLIQALIDEALCDGGYEPAIVASGEEAVTLLQGNRQHYRALVSDINLKGTMDGWDVARQAREIEPSLPIVYTTGMAAEQWASQGVPNSILLTKPFAPAQLVTAISQLLNAGGQPVAPTS